MRIQALIVLAAVSLIAVGCGKGNFSQRQNAAQENVFRYPIPNNPTSLDPGIVQDGDTLDLLQQVYEGLVTWGPNNEVVPAIAESWEVKEDGRVFAFKIKPGVKFHNGREVTAEDVKWSIERACDPVLKSTTADAYLSDVIGVTDKVNGKATEVEGVKVTGPDTIEFHLKQPTPYFLGKLTYMVSAVVPKESVPADSEINELKEVVGTGPFKMVSYDAEQLVTLEAFDDYHGGKVKLAKIERPVIKDATTRLTKYKNGEVDLVQLQRQDIEAIEADPNLKDHLQLFQRPAIWYVGMNELMYPPFKDRRVRQAFAMSIDKEKIVNDLMGGINTIANSIVPPGIRGHREQTKAFRYDPEQAKQLLAAAGFPDGKGLPPLTMTFRESYPDIRLVAEAVAGQIKQTLGVEVKLQTMEWRSYLEKYNAKEQTFYHMRWAADYLDPQNFLSHMLATWGPENKIGYNNPEFDRLCKQADSLMDWEQRLPLYAEAEDTVLQDAVWVPIYFQRDAELHRPGLTGMRESLFGHLPHTTVEIKR